MLLSCIRQAARHRLTHPRACLTVAQLPAARERPGAALSARQPRAAQDRREIPRPAASPAATLTGRPTATTLPRGPENLDTQPRGGLQLHDRPPPEPLIILLGGVMHQPGELQPRQPPLHTLAMSLDKPPPRRVVAPVRDPAPAHDLRQPEDQLRDRATVATRPARPGPLLPSPPPPQIAMNGQQRRLQARVPHELAIGVSAGLSYRRQDLDAGGLAGQLPAMTKRPTRRRPRPAADRWGSECHRQRRGHGARGSIQTTTRPGVVTAATITLLAIPSAQAISCCAQGLGLFRALLVGAIEDQPDLAKTELLLGLLR